MPKTHTSKRRKQFLLPVMMTSLSRAARVHGKTLRADYRDGPPGVKGMGRKNCARAGKLRALGTAESRARDPAGAAPQILGRVTPFCPWYLPPRSL